MSGGFGAHIPRDTHHGEGPFLLQILGLPRQWNWQDLKDVVRSSATHGLRAEVKTGGRGIVRLSRWVEARNLYSDLLTGYLATNYFQEVGHRLLVEIWDVTPDEEPKCLWRNWDRDAGQGAQEAPQAAQRSPWQYSTPPAQLYPSSFPYGSSLDAIADSQVTLEQGMERLQVAPQPVPQTPTYPTYAIAQYQSQLQQRQSSSANPYAHPSSGAVGRFSPAPLPMATGHRYAQNTVFVSNMPHEVETNDILKAFSVCGNILKCDPPNPDKRNGTTGCSTTINFVAAEGATRALGVSGKSWGGSILSVRRINDQTDVPTTASSSTTLASSSATPASSAADPASSAATTATSAATAESSERNQSKAGDRRKKSKPGDPLIVDGTRFRRP